MQELQLDPATENSNAAQIGKSVAETVYNWFQSEGTPGLGGRLGSTGDPSLSRSTLVMAVAGANPYGTARSSKVGKRYGDTTHYFPVNDIPSRVNRMDCSRLRAVDHWVPLNVSRVAWNAPENGSSVQTFDDGGVQAVQWKPLCLTSNSTWVLRVSAAGQLSVNRGWHSHLIRVGAAAGRMEHRRNPGAGGAAARHQHRVRVHRGLQRSARHLRELHGLPQGGGRILQRAHGDQHGWPVCNNPAHQFLLGGRGEVHAQRLTCLRMVPLS